MASIVLSYTSKGLQCSNGLGQFSNSKIVSVCVLTFQEMYMMVSQTPFFLDMINLVVTVVVLVSWKLNCVEISCKEILKKMVRSVGGTVA